MLSSAYIPVDRMQFFNIFSPMWLAMMWYRWPKNHRHIHEILKWLNRYALLLTVVINSHLFGFFCHAHAECEWVFNPQIYDFRIVSFSLLLLFLFVVGCYCCCLFVFRLHYFKKCKISVSSLVNVWQVHANEDVTKKKERCKRKIHFRKS